MPATHTSAKGAKGAARAAKVKARAGAKARAKSAKAAAKGAKLSQSISSYYARQSAPVTITIAAGVRDKLAAALGVAEGAGGAPRAPSPLDVAMTLAPGESMSWLCSRRAFGVELAAAKRTGRLNGHVFEAREALALAGRGLAPVEVLLITRKA